MKYIKFSISDRYINEYPQKISKLFEDLLVLCCEYEISKQARSYTCIDLNNHEGNGEKHYSVKILRHIENGLDGYVRDIIDGFTLERRESEREEFTRILKEKDTTIIDTLNKMKRLKEDNELLTKMLKRRKRG